MKWELDPKTDALYIEISDKKVVETVPITDSVNADFAEDGTLVGLDVHANASKMRLDELEFKNLPTPKSIKFG
jgi:uncharacterized protein YuzE